MRGLLLSLLAAAGLLSASGVAAAAECPLDLSLKMAPDEFVAKLGAMPSFHSQRTEQKPFLAKCTYKASHFIQFGDPATGLCSLEGQHAVGSMAEILDTESVVVQHGFMLLKSDESLAALRSALDKIAAPVDPKADPDAWKTDRYTTIDSVYGHGDDLWIVSHKPPEPGVVSRAPDIYLVQHVVREWLDFARRDLNTCKELPASARG
jgi:hypothetical protein